MDKNAVARLCLHSEDAQGNLRRECQQPELASTLLLVVGAELGHIEKPNTESGIAN